MYISDAVNAVFNGNNFTLNSAAVVVPSSSSTKLLQAKGLGGALYYGCYSDSILAAGLKCNVSFTNGNKFVSNSAQNDGGAI